MNKVIVMRFLRGLGAVLLAFLAAWLVGPDAADLIPEDLQVLLVTVVAPALLALEKLLRDGGDAEA